MKFHSLIVLLACVALGVPASARELGAPVPAADTAVRVKTPGITEKDLEQWCRDLKDKNPSAAYAKLSVLAGRKAPGELGLRAALALGYYDFLKGRYAQAQVWLDKATEDPILREYALFWDAQTLRDRGDNARAIELLDKFRTEFPDSVIHDLALQSLGEAEIAANQPEQAAAALSADPATAKKPELIFLRGQAYEQANHPDLAVADYLTVMYQFPTSEPSREAASKVQYFQGVLGDKFPQVPLDEKLARAATLYNAHDWPKALDAYNSLLPELSGIERDRAILRQIQCRLTMGASPSELENLKVEDPDVDAERLSYLTQAYRAKFQESQMVAAAEQAAQRAPQSVWAEQALYTVANYYWVQLDRDQAASYYHRVEENFPSSPDADNAQWRVAWAAYLDRRSEAAALMEAHLLRFPTSPYTPDALYWLGREAESLGNVPRARSFYTKLEERFPNDYFEQLGHERLRAMGPGELGDSDVLSAVPPRPAAKPLGSEIPEEVRAQKERADALRSIAFDSSAELELKAAYAKSSEPRLLLDAAEEYARADQFGGAIGMIRQVFPQIETRPFSDVPIEAWHTAYPLPYAASLRRASEHAGVDPMLVAGLIRQESTFNPNAVSHAGAYGLMQLMPGTARKLARQLRVGYSHSRLVDPEYNARLGIVYLSGLKKSFGSVEAALAAYNAGEDRVSSWEAGQNYRETAEFVESIPFTETRQYVQIVMRNAQIYRTVYRDSE